MHDGPPIIGFVVVWTEGKLKSTTSDDRDPGFEIIENVSTNINATVDQPYVKFRADIPTSYGMASFTIETRQDREGTIASCGKTPQISVNTGGTIDIGDTSGKPKNSSSVLATSIQALAKTRGPTNRKRIYITRYNYIEAFNFQPACLIALYALFELLVV